MEHCGESWTLLWTVLLVITQSVQVVYAGDSPVLLSNIPELWTKQAINTLMGTEGKQQQSAKPVMKSNDKQKQARQHI